MRGLLSILEELHVIVNWHTSVESGASNLLEVLCESLELFLNLVSELSSIAENQGGGGLWISLIDLVKNREDEDSSLTHSGHSLAEDVVARHGGWDAFLLHFGRMLKSTLGDSSGELALQEEVLEGSGVNSSVGGHPKVVSVFHILTYLFSAVLFPAPLGPPSKSSGISISS